MILLIDNFDSFTYNLVDYFTQLGLKVIVKRNNIAISELLHERYQGIVLSPGPGKPEDAGNLMEVVHHYHTQLPILGICLGHQAIGQYFGAKLSKARLPMHGKISTVTHQNDQLFQDLPRSFDVVRYHSLLCETLGNSLETIAETNTGEVMALKHKQWPIYGLQFHPEAVLTQFGLEILRNWKNINSICN
ncbi:MAG: aminodeoxychorismate/anthranilate synthase component II [Cyclobacteriaceae bacterium]|nr:aminodeoxychorismate/anthranilate synthase component II [Cyclobacteriaceae bacterium]